MMKFTLLLLLLCSGVYQISATKRNVDDFHGLVDALVQYTAEEPNSDEVTKVNVNLQQEVASVHVEDTTHLDCDYTISGEVDLPVTVTWKVGNGPETRDAETILECSGYKHSDRQCASLTRPHASYGERVNLYDNSPSLQIAEVSSDDGRNYWCQVSVDGSSDFEMGFDMKSIVLRVYEGHNKPKMNSVQMGDEKKTAEGSSVTLDCQCTEGSYHCDDVIWYKGPTDGSHSTYALVYSKKTNSRPLEPTYEAYGEWENRATLSGKSLVLSEVKTSDTGRYWCEVRAASYYGIGEWAIDAKSVVLEVE